MSDDYTLTLVLKDAEGKIVASQEMIVFELAQELLPKTWIAMRDSIAKFIGKAVEAQQGGPVERIPAQHRQ